MEPVRSAHLGDRSGADRARRAAGAGAPRPSRTPAGSVSCSAVRVAAPGTPRRSPASPGRTRRRSTRTWSSGRTGTTRVGPVSEIDETDPGWTIWTGTVPGGETAEQVAARLDRVVGSGAGRRGRAGDLLRPRARTAGPDAALARVRRQARRRTFRWTPARSRSWVGRRDSPPWSAGTRAPEAHRPTRRSGTPGRWSVLTDGQPDRRTRWDSSTRHWPDRARTGWPNWTFPAARRTSPPRRPGRTRSSTSCWSTGSATVAEAIAAAPGPRRSGRARPAGPMASRGVGSSWAASGLTRYQGGTLAGVISKLDYLRDLGVTTVWLSPVFRQRGHLDTYHGYGIQDFLDVDPRFGSRTDLVELVRQAHDRGMRVLLDVIFNHSGANWHYPPGTPGGERDAVLHHRAATRSAAGSGEPGSRSERIDRCRGRRLAGRATGRRHLHPGRFRQPGRGFAGRRPSRVPADRFRGSARLRPRAAGDPDRALARLLHVLDRARPTATASGSTRSST